MELNSEEKDMLAGGRGVVVRDAMAFQISVGEFWGAERFVPISNAHMMGDIEVMGDAGLDWLEHSCEHKATCSVPTTTNPRCFDFNHVQDLGQDPGEAEKEKRIIRILRDNRGATAIEYGLIAALIAVAAITAMTALGNQLTTTVSNVSNNMKAS